MKIYFELELNNFNAWSGAIETLKRVKEANQIEELENILDELYPDGMSETELNDLLWFEPETIFEWLGIEKEEEEEE